MKLKFFIIVSLLVHIIGGIGLYFYYNPIIFTPESLKVSQEEETEDVLPPSSPKIEKQKSHLHKKKKVFKEKKTGEITFQNKKKRCKNSFPYKSKTYIPN